MSELSARAIVTLALRAPAAVTRHARRRPSWRRVERCAINRGAASSCAASTSAPPTSSTTTTARCRCPRSPPTIVACSARSFGMNSLRLPVSWSYLEPTRGSFDRAFIDKILALAADCNSEGVYTLVDLHQDGWSKYVGADGAPFWAHDRPCRRGHRSRAGNQSTTGAAVQAAFNGFFADATLVQDYATMAAHLAQRHRQAAGHHRHRAHERAAGHARAARHALRRGGAGGARGGAGPAHLLRAQRHAQRPRLRRPIRSPSRTRSTRRTSTPACSRATGCRGRTRASTTASAACCPRPSAGARGAHRSPSSATTPPTPPARPG